MTVNGKFVRRDGRQWTLRELFQLMTFKYGTPQGIREVKGATLLANNSDEKDEQQFLSQFGISVDFGDTLREWVAQVGINMAVKLKCFLH